MNLNDLPVIGIIRRSGDVVSFNPEKIRAAVAKAFLFDENGKPYVSGQTSLSAAQREQVDAITESVTAALIRRMPSGGNLHIEDIQDQVELALMRMGEHKIARAYVLFRQSRAAERAESAPAQHEAVIEMVGADGITRAITAASLLLRVEEAAHDLDGVDAKEVAEAAFRDLYNGVPEDKVSQALVLAARSRIEQAPDYAKLAARLLLNDIRHEVLGEYVPASELAGRHVSYFPEYIRKGIDAELLDERLGQFDLERLAAALVPERDGQFEYLGLQTLYDRYFLHIEDRRIELPQVFFMRVAMGLAINEVDREKWAIEFYNVLSTFDYMSSTPTLFNAGTRHSQLSSCYLTTISDDLDGIYQGIKENALLQKFAGGLGNDWTNVRAMGARIKGTNGKSQGVIPFLKVVNDTAVAVNQGGKRKGAVCGYLETWHLDIEEFLDLRKNTGDDRRRTHDMNTANWIPDLFMKRVMEGGDWTLFSPSDVPDLHDKYGRDFEDAYTRYEEKARTGEIKLFKIMPAVNLWRKMLTMLFETGHPWITFKDPCNIRSPQQHVGVVHSSNLCTEITLNTSADEIAVCNLGSVNLVNHLVGGTHLDLDKLRGTVRVAMRMLDNVVDVNYYAVGKARNANLKHRPVGLGMMGFQDALQVMGVPYASERAVEIADSFAEALCYYAYEASSDLAIERGRYSSFKGSLWDRGITPFHSMRLLGQERGNEYLDCHGTEAMLDGEGFAVFDWDSLAEKIQRDGMRNSNCVAIAPTATIANIVGVSASIEPTYQNLYVKSNLSGEFTMVNKYLVKKLKDLKMWDAVMVSDLKFFDGSLAKIDRVPQEVKEVFATAFEIDPKWLVECAARRQKWIDQAQSLNIYMAGASGKKLDEIYKLAWMRGLKTTYYLRTLGATSAEKSTGQGGELNAVSAKPVLPEPEIVGKACTLRPGDPGFEECEACQ